MKPKGAEDKTLETTQTTVQKPWIVEEKGENVHLIRFKYTPGWQQHVLLISDLHFDHAKCKRKLLKKHLDQAIERNAPIIIAGDALCLMQGKFDPRKSYDSLLPQYKTDDYFGAIIEDATKFFEPYKDNIALIGYGNHETSVLRRQNVDMIKWLTRQLGCPRGAYQGFVRFMFEHEDGGKRQSKTLFYNHGTGGGGPVTRGAITSNRENARIDGVDIFLRGHIHEAWAMETPKLMLSAQHIIKHRKVLHIQSATYKDEIGTGAHGWANEKNFPVKPEGGYWLKFWANHNTVFMGVERTEQ